ncbi:hypothetical protein LTS02_013243 [Friedmanniomyces endolithicus]|nr:hypothetical protein LTS02_013243 [Friedmanniomyces endolithicus]
MAGMDTYEESRPYEGTYRTSKPEEGMQDYGYGYRGHTLLEGGFALTSLAINDREYTKLRATARVRLVRTVTGTPESVMSRRTDATDIDPPPKRRVDDDEDDESVNPGSKLFVTGIHPRLSESEVSRLFENYGTDVVTSALGVVATATAMIATAESVVVEESAAVERTVVAATIGRPVARQPSATAAMRHLQPVTRPLASTLATAAPTIEVAKEVATSA